jgi:hypothetical protein
VRANRGPQPAASMGALQARLAHQPGHPFARAADDGLAERGMDAGRAIRPPALGVDGVNARQEALIGLRPRRGRPGAPRVVAAGGDAKYAAHGGNVVGGLLPRYEPEGGRRLGPVSCAK